MNSTVPALRRPRVMAIVHRPSIGVLRGLVSAER